MNLKEEWKILLILVSIFIVSYFLPVGNARFDTAIFESLHLLKEYARLHVLFCLLPAFYIAGAVGVFMKKEAVMKYLGPKANKFMAYGVASVSGTILAVCSCTVLPLFAGIYNMGAGIGPATTFLYSGPAINVLAIVLSARVLGIEIGVARAIGAIVFSVIIGLSMHFIFKKDEKEVQRTQMAVEHEEPSRKLWQNILFFLSMVGILIFANFAAPSEKQGIWSILFNMKWYITAFWSLALGAFLILWFDIKWWKISIVAVIALLFAIILPGKPIFPFITGLLGLSIILAKDDGEGGEWFENSWFFAKQILPLLFAGVLIAGLLLGRPGNEGLIPSSWIHRAVGGNGIFSNVLASVLGAFMYFATLTEVPILQGLIGNGMGKGPALALLLSGPALSLPNMLVIRSIMGTKKTIVFVILVVIIASLTGIIYGLF